MDWELLKILVYVRMSDEIDAIFCTSDPANHATCDTLIKTGFLIEIESIGGNDRSYALTDRGKNLVSKVTIENR